MTPFQEARVVAAKAQVFAALALRATIEDHPEHPRAEHLREGSARWLKAIRAWDLAVEPPDEAILEAPVGRLSAGRLDDCRWSGEALAVLAWSIGLGGTPPEWEPVSDVTPVLEALGMTNEDAARAAQVQIEARLRDAEECREYFERLSVVQWATREARVRRGGKADPASVRVLRDFLDERLAAAGIFATDADLEEARTEVERMGPAGLTGSVPGLILVRQLAAEWVVVGGTRYWASRASSSDSSSLE